MHNSKKIFRGWAGILAAAVLLLLLPVCALAAVNGVSGSSFALTVKADHISTADGTSLFLWWYANGAARAQYPGPTLIVIQGQAITVTLKNQLDTPVSIVFAGQTVTATGGLPGLLAREALKNDDPATLAVDESTVTYSFTPAEPGTYLYSSGTDPHLQVQMGLLGAMVVRPATNATMIGCDPTAPARVMATAYGDCRSAYDHETLFILSETDPALHSLVETGRINEVKTTEFFPVNWFINGRGGPDTLAPFNASWLPTQPYDCFVRTTPGARVLLRMVGAGRDSHPFHTHGNNMDVIARDGRLLSTAPANPLADRPAEVGVVPDLAVSNFTNNTLPGATYDAIYAWTGRNLGWDVYGPIDDTCTDTAPADGFADGIVPLRHCHNASCTDTAPADGFDDFTKEWCADHGTPFPVLLPAINSLTFGQFYSGSPFLGSAGALPPGEGGFNPNAGFFFMWHSHNEKELTNNDIFPGGLLTMLVVEPPGTPIE
jgi:hypothetical protein